MIKIFLSDAHLWIWFPFDRATIAKIKDLPNRTYDPDRRRWLVPLADWQEVQEAFPHAQWDEDARAAIGTDADQAVRRFVRSLAQLRVALELRDDQVVAVGEGVSPTLQEEVDKRASAIIRMNLTQEKTS